MKPIALGFAAALILAGAVRAVVAPPPAAAPFLVQDLAPGENAHAGSYPNVLVEVGDRVLFLGRTADQNLGVFSLSLPGLEVEAVPGTGYPSFWFDRPPTSEGGRAVWLGPSNEGRMEFYCSDGSSAGTRVVYRFPSGFPTYGAPGWVGILDGIALFGGYDLDWGLELWRSDCTTSGTYRISDLAPGPAWSTPRAFLRLGSELCFLADATTGTGLFCSDGTSEGTRLIERFDYVVGDAEVENPLVEIDDRLIFVASDGSREEVVGSDGTSSGTQFLTDLPPPGGIVSRPFRSANRAYFVADDVTHGQELWQTDGTVAGTRRISEFGYANAFSPWIEVDLAANTGNWVYFLASDGLSTTRIWRSDGEPASTQPVGGDGIETDPSGDPPLVAVGGRVLYVASGPKGRELYSIDGARGTIELLADPCTGPCSSDPTVPYSTGQAWFFEASDGSDREIYRTDGTPSGTHRVTATEAGSSGIQTSSGALLYRGNQLIYAGADSLHGAELFVSDLSSAPSVLVADLAGGATASAPFEVTSIGSSVVFVYCRDSELLLASSAALSTDVEVLANLGYPCPYHPGFVSIERLGSHAFLLDRLGYPGSLLRTNGTEAGTEVLLTTEEGSELGPATSGGGFYWFVRTDGDATQIWKVPEASGPATLHAALPSGLKGVKELFQAGSYLYFVSREGEYGSWRVVRLATSSPSFEVLAPDFSYSPDSLYGGPSFAWNGTYVFFRTGIAEEAELWRDDPAHDSTLLLTPAPEVGGVRDLVSGDGFIDFFVLRDDLSLWRSDGTVEGTVQVASIGRQDDLEEYRVRSVARVGGWLAFSAWSEPTGRELWLSDGSPSGTFPIPEVSTGLSSSDPSDFAATDDSLFFTGSEPVHGREIWRVDFAAGRVDRLSDIGPGSYSGNPTELSATDSALFFQADDGLHGSELWSLPLPTGTCIPNERALCLDEGRFQVSAYWSDFFGGSGDGRAVPLTQDTGYFWYFDPANVETVLKVLDALGVNNRFWVFYGALSNVEYALDVTDTTTRVKKRYLNPAGRYASVGDTDAFSADGALTAGPTNTAETPGTDGRPMLLDSLGGEVAASGTCTPSPTRLCLQQGRFAVEATWRDFQGNAGIGAAVALSADTGYFWFFWDTNVEVILKVLDGRPLNDRFWVYYGALSNVEYTLTVTDTETGAIKTYFNPAGRFASVGDNEAF